MIRTSFWANCHDSSVRKLILAWLRHQTCSSFLLRPVFPCCFQITCGKLEKVPMTLVFSVYWVSISKMVKTLNYPSHSILSRINFQQLGQLPKPITLKPLIVWGRVNILWNSENVIYNAIIESFLRFHLFLSQKFRFLRLLKSAQSRILAVWPNSKLHNS
jgi:hypothetical protein